MSKLGTGVKIAPSTRKRQHEPIINCEQLPMLHQAAAVTTIKKIDDHKQVVKPVPRPQKKVTSKVPWYYRSDSGDMELYQADQSAEIEAMYMHNTHSPQSLLINGSTYTFDFEHMYQINVNSRHKRQIQRGTDAKRPVVSACSLMTSCEVTASASSTSTSAVPSSPVTHMYQWQWEDDAGSYSSYDTSTSLELTDAYLADPSQSVFCFIGSNIYMIDFSAMVQITKKRRNVTRIPTAGFAGSSECIEWYFHSEQGQVEAYSDGHSAMIETMYRAGSPRFLKLNGNTYIFDFDHFCQTNVSTNSKQSIERHTKPQQATTSKSPARELKDQLPTESEQSIASDRDDTPLGQHYPLPPNLSAAAVKRLMEIAEKRGVRCTVEVEAIKDEPRRFLVLKGPTSAVNSVMKSILQEIIECQSSELPIEIPKEWEPQTTEATNVSLC